MSSSPFSFAKEINMAANTTATETKVMEEPKVRIFIPLQEQDDSSLAVEQVEYVTINGENTAIQRGQYVDVSVPVFIQLRNRYPHI